MSQKRAILWAIAGVFIMFSFSLILHFAFVTGSPLPWGLVGLVFAAIGFYILGYSFDIE